MTAASRGTTMTHQPPRIPDYDDELDPRAEAEPTPGRDDDRRSDEEIAQLLHERDEYKDLLLRKSAEFDNYRKRIEKERRERESEAALDVLTDLLPLVDDFERALKADAGVDAEVYRAGVEIIHNQLMDFLGRRGIVPIDTVGRDFDPHFHQAVDHMESPGHRDGEVIDELRRGYLHHDRLLRPALVRVAKA